MEIRPGPAALMAAMLFAAAALPPLALFLVATGAVIAVHEAAHALIAHRVGVGIETAGLGFGPLVARVPLRGVALELRAIPAGGYVGLVGMSRVGPRAFAAAPRPARAAILAAGPLANLLLGALLLIAAPFATGAAPDRAVAAAGEIAGLIGGGTVDALLRPFLTGDAIALPIAGPLGAAGVIAASASSVPMLLVAGSMLSIGIGLANLLPLPLIDGGRLVDLVRDRPAPTGRGAAAPAFALVAGGIIIDLLRIVADHPYAPHF